MVQAFGVGKVRLGAPLPQWASAVGLNEKGGKVRSGRMVRLELGGMTSLKVFL